MTPVLAVINELVKNDKSLQVRFICDRAFETQSRGIMQHSPIAVKISVIRAGKLRRYHDETWLQRISDWKTIGLNLRDMLFICVGTLQSILLLIRDRPDVMFAKGGFVCLPAGIAAWALRVPLVIHDSDTRPGLTNRIIARWAKIIGTGAPLSNYNYPRSKTEYVGVPIDDSFRPFSLAEQRQAKSAIGIVDIDRPLVVLTGGGLGSVALNTAMTQSAQFLVDHGISVYHVTGKAHYEKVNRIAIASRHYICVPFIYSDMSTVLGAADVVVSRASATTLQELAGLAKPVIAVPAAQLGDQNKNALMYGEARAAVILHDKDIVNGELLGETLVDLLHHKNVLHELSQRLYQFAKPHAANSIANMIRRSAKGKE